MDRSHLRTDQPLDVPSKMRFATRPPNDLDAFIPASPLECPASKVSAVVDLDGFRQSGHRPVFFNLTLAKPSGLVENGMQKAEADRQPGRRVHGQIESSDHASEDIERKSQPRPTNGFTCLFIDDERVDFV
jgi:hypothetical protein